MSVGPQGTLSAPCALHPAGVLLRPAPVPVPGWGMRMERGAGLGAGH